MCVFVFYVVYMFLFFKLKNQNIEVIKSLSGCATELGRQDGHPGDDPCYEATAWAPGRLSPGLCLSLSLTSESVQPVPTGTPAG